MRLIDADALEKLLTDMATDARSIRELQLNALCYAAVKNESMTPTIDAIPVEWLRDRMFDMPDADEALSKAAWRVMRAWKERDGDADQSDK